MYVLYSKDVNHYDKFTNSEIDEIHIHQDPSSSALGRAFMTRMRELVVWLQNPYDN